MPGFHSHDDDFLYKVQCSPTFEIKESDGATAGNMEADQAEEVDGGGIKNARVYVRLSRTQLAALKRIARLRRTSVSALAREGIAAVLKKST
jgi:hypothetical protein